MESRPFMPRPHLYHYIVRKMFHEQGWGTSKIVMVTSSRQDGLTSSAGASTSSALGRRGATCGTLGRRSAACSTASSASSARGATEESSQTASSSTGTTTTGGLRGLALVVGGGLHRSQGDEPALVIEQR